MNPMFYVLIVVVAALLLGFAGFWLKDRDRTHEQASDGDRLDP